MSSRTECNFCTLKRLRSSGKRRGARTYVRKGTGLWDGWIVITQSDRSAPVCYFRELPHFCMC